MRGTRHVTTTHLTAGAEFLHQQLGTHTKSIVVIQNEGGVMGEPYT